MSNQCQQLRQSQCQVQKPNVLLSSEQAMNENHFSHI